MLEFHTLDVFTETPFAGNPLAVVLAADGLTTGQMQRIAREFNLSETIFVQRPEIPGHTAKVRIFFPTAEIPFAGHPTIGCAILLAGQMQQEGDFATRILLEEQAGLVPVDVRRTGLRTVAELTAPVIPHPHPGTAPPDLVAAALGLPGDAIGFGSHRPGVFAGGPAFLFVPVADRDALARAVPVHPHWPALMASARVDCAYLYTPGTDTDFCARMFSPTAGIPEDPATGSATAILAAQVQASGALSPGTTRFRILQGVEMGRPSHLSLAIDSTGAGITAVRIAGSAVAISSGQILAPPADST